MEVDGFSSDSDLDVQDILNQLADKGIKTKQISYNNDVDVEYHDCSAIPNDQNKPDTCQCIDIEMPDFDKDLQEIPQDLESDSNLEYLPSSSENEASFSDVENIPEESENVEVEDCADTDMFGEKSRSNGRKKVQKREAAKQSRERGESYLGYRKPQGSKKIFQDSIKSERKLGPTCQSNACLKSRARGCSKFSQTVRKHIFDKFWQDMDWKQRKIYVSNLVQVIDPKRRTSENSENIRQKTLQYYLKNDNETLQVCRNMFLNTLGVKYATIRGWVEKQEYGIVKPTNFSKRTNCRNSTFKEQKEFLSNFLKTLPTVPSHYCRKTTSKQYLQPPISSISEVFNMYEQKCNEDDVSKLSKRYFYQAFREENIGIFSPKKDQCDICVAHKVGNILDEEYHVHLKAKDKARASKDADKKLALERKINLFCMDLQAVKLCPALKASSLYFKTKLTVHNFTIYDMCSKRVKCYWFDETNADLTASTFVSLIIKFFEEVLESNLLPIILYSDGCTYQNRNVVLSNALLHLSVKYKVQITQKYLAKGHTQMECDSVHSVIENKLKDKEIFLPSQYILITKEARTKPFPYDAESVDFSQILDYAQTSNYVYKSIRPGNLVGDETVTSLKVILYDPSGTIFYKTDYDNEFEELPQRKITKSSTCDITYPRLHSERIKIAETKFKHLQELKFVIPKDCHAFYDSLPYNVSRKK